MSLLAPALRRGALPFLLLLGNGRAFAPPAATAIGRRGRVHSLTSVPPLLAAPSNPEFDERPTARKRDAAARIARGVARHAAKALPSALLAASCAAGFPRPAAAFPAGDYLGHALTKRNAVGAAVVAATCLQVVRVARDPPSEGALRAEAAEAEVEDAAVDATNGSKRGKIPITVLAGFLGAGKTTALKRLLENTEGIKVGTIVNDMAAVNIDAKLISNPMNNGDGRSNAVGKGNTGGTVELQNGCACCSLSDELLTSVSDLMEGRDLDAIVVELSGVADPAAVKQNWDQAVKTKHLATETAELGRVVTVIDSHTFGTDWMSWDSAGKREWAAEDDKCAGSRQVPELLAEQVEAADVLILNKIDLSEGEQLETAKLVVRNLNKKAEMIETKFGEMTPEKIIGAGFAQPLEVIDDGHSHNHEHDHCSDPDCTDASHSHAHEHAAAEHAAAEASCGDPSCTDDSHSHHHSSEASEACADPDCNDSSHSHSHSHKSTATDNLGISNFVYKSSRPFDPQKLQRLLMTWPIPVMEELKLVELSKELEKAEDEKSEQSPFVGVLRSKGFAWVSPSIMSGPFNDLDRHDTVMYWSHAGKHFGLNEAGSWWASMGKEAMKKVFEDNVAEYERIIKEDFVSGEWGDRRQEIVFIGAGLDEKGIADALDDCLCTDEQIAEYKQGILDAINEYYAQQ